MWWALWTSAAGALIVLVFYCRSRRLAGRVAVLTGGDSGAGLLIARELVKRGTRVVIAGNDETYGSEAAGRLSRETGGCVQYRKLDLASLKSVREFAADFRASERRLDLLINNAAVTQLENTLTEDGIVIEMQINHFAPFLLTNLLLPLLEASAQGRVITASSVMHYLGNINLDSLADRARDKHAHKRVFANSKLCNILFTRELARRLGNSKVTTNCFHPGVVNREPDDKVTFSSWFNWLRSFLVSGSPELSQDEATTAVYLATSPDLATVSGKYFVDCKETKPSKMATDDVLAGRLWSVSERVVKLCGETLRQ